MAPDCAARLPAALRAAIRRDRSANRQPPTPNPQDPIPQDPIPQDPIPQERTVSAPRQDEAVSAPRRDEGLSGRQQAAGSHVGRPVGPGFGRPAGWPAHGRIDMSAQVAEHLRAATAQMITGACLALAAALVDEHNLQHPIDHLGETFHVNRLHTIFRMLACRDDSGRVTIDADGHFRALLQDAVAIALEAATERLRGAAAGEQRRQAASELSELRALSLQLAPLDRHPPRRRT